MLVLIGIISGSGWRDIGLLVDVGSRGGWRVRGLLVEVGRGGGWGRELEIISESDGLERQDDIVNLVSLALISESDRLER